MLGVISNFTPNRLPVIYSARWVLPIIAPPIEDGAVAIEDSTIAAVGTKAEVAERIPNAAIQDLGEAAILPGLVNAHSHLELTAMRGFLEGEEHDFFAWLRKLTVARMALTDEDLFVSATCGAIEAIRAGITCVGDSSSFAAHPTKALQAVGLRGIVYQESFGPDPKVAQDNIEHLREQLDQLRREQTDLVRVGVSPHAPYTVSTRQLELTSRFALDERLPLMMHAAESEAEEQLLLHGAGPFVENLQQRGIEWRAPCMSAVKYLKACGVLETKPLFAHCIRVDDDDLALIKQSGSGIAHCPKSNAKLGHGRAPFEKFIAHGINAGLGSDSVASNNTCDILEEARFATLLGRSASQDAQFTAEQALFAATLGGARALGLDQQVGALKKGMQADICVVSLDGLHQKPPGNPIETLIFSSSGHDVVATIVGGKELYRGNCFNAIDEREFISRLGIVRTTLNAVARLTS